MVRIRRQLRIQLVSRSLLASACLITISSVASAAPPERPNLNHTANPRPNILPDGLYNFWVPYRATHNRPSYAGGAIAYHLSRTSQEAMVWQENVEACRYHPHHQPPVYKGYFYPKPWEALNVGARPDFVRSTNTPAVPQPMNEPVIEQAVAVPAAQ